MPRYRRGICAPGLSRGRPEGFDVLGKTLAMREVNFCPATFSLGTRAYTPLAAHAKDMGAEQFADGDRHLLLGRLAGLVCRSERVVGYPACCRSLRQCEHARSPSIERQQARQIQAP